MWRNTPFSRAIRRPPALLFIERRRRELDENFVGSAARLSSPPAQPNIYYLAMQRVDGGTDATAEFSNQPMPDNLGRAFIPRRL
jgi:hypothetical protein